MRRIGEHDDGEKQTEDRGSPAENRSFPGSVDGLRGFSAQSKGEQQADDKYTRGERINDFGKTPGTGTGCDKHPAELSHCHPDVIRTEEYPTKADEEKSENVLQ